MNCGSICFEDNREELKEGVRQLVLSIDPEVFGTAVFNSYASLERGRYTLNRFHSRVDTAIFGRSLSNLPMKDRTFFFSFPERIPTNLHYHLYIRPPFGKIERFMEIAPEIWKEICPSGNLKLDLIASETDLRKGSYYITKDCFMERNFANFIISSEFCF